MPLISQCFGMHQKVKKGIVRQRSSRKSFYKSNTSMSKLKQQNIQNLLNDTEMMKEETEEFEDYLANGEYLSEEEGEEEQFVEVFLTAESFSQDTTSDVRLGGVPFRAYKGTLAQLREQMYLSLCALPVDFMFITKNGTSILKPQEASLRVSQIWDGQTNIIRIQRNYGKPRVGLATYDNQSIGFVFAEHNHSISTLRTIVKQQLGEIGNPKRGIGYQFMDRNGWPLSLDQENNLTIIDCMLNGVIKVRPPVFDSSSSSSVPALMDKIHDKKFGSIESIPEKRKKTVILPSDHTRREVRLAESRSVSIRTSIGLDGLEPKQILISYVRAEAAQYALRLKEFLIDDGFSVYLDVHEIKSGKDWQDALNYAVSNCEVFVPLVTPRYGETRWTNREVKLADVLQKLIIPVSFVDNWPPKCLAIQFATTQYISGDTNDPREAEECDRYEEDHEPVIRRVAEQVGDRVREADRMARLGRTKLTKRNSVLKSYAGPPLPPDFKQLSDELSADRPGVPLVVISVHPEQKIIGNQLKNVLEDEGYEVWCTTELLNGSENGFNSTSESQESEESIDSQKTLTQESQETSSICLNKLSQMSRLSTDDAQITEMNLKFQQKADEAGLVLFVLSEAFARSKTCKQHVFYCEHRKRVIPVRFDDFPMPTWMSMLIGTGVLEVIIDATKEGYEETLLARVKAMLDKTARGDGLSDSNGVDEEKINKIKQLKEELPKRVYVYVAGSTKFYNDKSEEICKKIGKHLAHVEDIHMVTGGFLGVGEEIGKSFFEERQHMDETPNVWHVLPKRDDRDRSHQSLQNKDLTFQELPYGDTIFIGDSVREREVIVSRVFDICILVEGGPGAAHEAEQFTWSDHVVIPVSSTGGAASGLFNVPDKIFRVPEGAQECDFKILANSTASAEEIAQALKRIVRGVRDKLYLDSPSAQGPLHSPLKSPRSLASQRTALSRMKTFQFSSTVDED